MRNPTAEDKIREHQSLPGRTAFLHQNPLLHTKDDFCTAQGSSEISSFSQEERQERIERSREPRLIQLEVVDGDFKVAGGKVAKLQILVAGEILAPITIRARLCFPFLSVAQISTRGK